MPKRAWVVLCGHGSTFAIILYHCMSPFPLRTVWVSIFNMGWYCATGEKEGMRTVLSGFLHLAPTSGPLLIFKEEIELNFEKLKSEMMVDQGDD